MQDEVRRRLTWIRLYEQTHDVGLVCRRCGISAPTLRKWLHRYQEQGEAGLIGQSRRPRTTVHNARSSSKKRPDPGTATGAQFRGTPHPTGTAAAASGSFGTRSHSQGPQAASGSTTTASKTSATTAALQCGPAWGTDATGYDETRVICGNYIRSVEYWCQCSTLRFPEEPVLAIFLIRLPKAKSIALNIYYPN